MNAVTTSQTEGWIRSCRVLRAALVGIVLGGALASCSQPPWKRGPDDARFGANCVHGQENRPTARTINYVDPELCARQVAKRGPYHVRTAPMPAEAIAQEK
jgi:hypothetical protein